ncbi:MAG TPA: nucleotide exchange factor GrpE, partial [Henriciella marina]|nr:nucleotide exchange factor GrpE [Henriciella marina]
MTEDQKRPPEAVETENLDAGSPESEVLEEAAEAENREPDAETRIAELEGEVTALKDQVLRAHAEMENVRKRSQKEIVDA